MDWFLFPAAVSDFAASSFIIPSLFTINPEVGDSNWTLVQRKCTCWFSSSGPTPQHGLAMVYWCDHTLPVHQMGSLLCLEHAGRETAVPQTWTSGVSREVSVRLRLKTQLCSCCFLCFCQYGNEICPNSSPPQQQRGVSICQSVFGTLCKNILDSADHLTEVGKGLTFDGIPGR